MKSQSCHQDDAHLFGSFEKADELSTAASENKTVPPAAAGHQPPGLYTNQRVQFLRVLAKAAPCKGEAGTPYPFCPSAPSLQREPELESSPSPRSRARTKEHSPLRQLALSAYSTSLHSRMPHGLSMPHPGFQALILCGPGIGLNTFTSVPHEYPKALVSIANRPMVWYALDWCYRMGVTDITIITPPSSENAIKTALAQNPYLTSLPSPSPDVLAPTNLDHTTPTADLLRQPEVQAAIKTDFVLLPCDLVCDIPGEVFLDSYLTNLGGLGAIGNVSEPGLERSSSNSVVLAGENSGRQGGLSIWYNTANREESVKNEECDFMCTSGLESSWKSGGLRLTLDGESSSGVLRNLAWAIPMTELHEECDEKKAWKIRQSIMKRYGDVKCLTKYRDSHIYLFPLWVKEFARLNPEFESISEDLVGTWAKCGWRKPSYRARYHTQKLLARRPTRSNVPDRERATLLEEDPDLLSLTTTQSRVLLQSQSQHIPRSAQLASRVPPELTGETNSRALASEDYEECDDGLSLPPILSCILPAEPNAPLLRRVDTTPLLLSVSLLLAKIPSIEETSSQKDGVITSPFAHSVKVAPTASIAQKVTISRSDSLIDSNTTIATMSVVKSSVIGSAVTIGTGVRLTNCLIMDGAVIGDKSVLNGTIVGKKAKIGKNCTLNSCEVQDGNVLNDRTGGKSEKYLIGGLEDDINGGEHFDDEDEHEGTISLSS